MDGVDPGSFPPPEGVDQLDVRDEPLGLLIGTEMTVGQAEDPQRGVVERVLLERAPTDLAVLARRCHAPRVREPDPLDVLNRAGAEDVIEREDAVADPSERVGDRTKTETAVDEQFRPRRRAS